jgi:predicted phosphodiesterase
MFHVLESCTFLMKRILPWALALAVPVACASRNDDESSELPASGVADDARSQSQLSTSNPEENLGEVTQPLSNGTVATDANLKIAFVGDTSDGSNWASVLTLAKNEGAAAVVTAGDMTYDSDPSGWWSKTESVLGQTYPVFLARGNHDDTSWSGFLAEASNHLGGASRTTGPHNAAYKTVFRGLTLLTITKGDTATTVNNLVGSDNHIWRVCNWHQNQAKMQVGGKGDEMGWAVYEACRQQGAIIVTGHEHSYERTKTLTSTTNQTIDSSCSGGSSLCVGLNRTFVSVIGTGGTGLRNQVRCIPTATSAPFRSLNTSDPSCPIWASIYTTDQAAKFGALFITFNVDGNPKKARGVFKNISGTAIDSFTIFHD